MAGSVVSRPSSCRHSRSSYVWAEEKRTWSAVRKGMQSISSVTQKYFGASLDQSSECSSEAAAANWESDTRRWNSRYLPRKVRRSDTMMEAPRLSSRSVLEKVPLLAYSASSRSARNVVNLASPDCSAQAIADPTLFL